MRVRLGTQVRAGQVARPVKPLAPGDTLSRAAALMRATGLSTIPVTEDGRVIGGVSEQALGRALLSDPVDAPLWPVARVLGDGLRVVPETALLPEALGILDDSPSGVGVVADWSGACQGVITRADVMSAWDSGVKPARIGGMATPLGVYLTGGGVQAGAGNLGLALTGVMLCLAVGAAGWALQALLIYGQRAFGVPLMAALNSTPAGTLHPLDLLPSVVEGLTAFLLCLALRLSPLSGYHAAEHQTVWALEQGEPLTLERVAQMPRPHPRCGTNLMVALSVYLVLAPISPLLALIGCLLAWRHLGYYVQLYLTTKKANRRQLESGIRAAQELITRYQERQVLGGRTRLARQIWNMGLLQVMAGFWACYGIIVLLGIDFPLIP
ncbi:MAG TPA: DUF1385 domain-containing protein [Armatimonadota bacterium]|jgi:CBS domain-containing protein